MPVLGPDTDAVYMGTLEAVAVYLGTAEVWTLAAPPVNTVAPVVSGGTSPPADLACSTGTWAGSPTSYAYQWQEFTGGVWVDVSGEVTNAYDDAPLGTYRCEVIATNAEGDSAPAYSNTVNVTSGTLRIFGFNAVVGVGLGFPSSADRALASKFAKSHAGTVEKIYARFRNDTTSGASGRITCHADNAGGTVPGTLLWSSQAAAIPAPGDLEFDLPLSGLSGSDGAANYWLVFVSDSFEADIAKSDTLADGQTIMANGSYSFSSPPSSWPGTDGTYDGPLCIWCEYTG